MNALRIPIAVFVSAMLTTSMFWVLWRLVGAQFDTGQFQEAQRIEFSRMRKDTEVQTKRDQKIERERPPPTPEAPRMAFSAGGLDNNVAQLAPVVDARGAMSRMSMTRGLRPRCHPARSRATGLSGARPEPWSSKGGCRSGSRSHRPAR